MPTVDYPDALSFAGAARRLPIYLGSLLISGVLAACAGWAAVVLASTPWEEARQLDTIFPFYAWRTRPYSATDYHAACLGLATCAAALAGVGFAPLLWAARCRAAVATGAREISHALAGMAAGLRALSRPQRGLALAVLASLTALRLYFSLANPEYDDAVSYEVFVSKGLLATSAFYPIPNNHVFSNTISLLFYQLHPGFWWSMRLPVLLISTGASVGWFAGLLRRAGFRVALLAVGLFSVLQLSLYHAGVGRGYWLLIGLAGIVFFSTLELRRPDGRQLAAWAGLLVAGVLGCYTVPPFVYVLASAYSWLGLQALRQRQWPRMGALLAFGLATLAGAGLLYTPLLLVSGWAALTGNGYVATLPVGEFWHGLPGYIWHTEGFLAGQRTLGAGITLAGLLLAGRLFWLNQAGRLPAAVATALRTLGYPALWFMLFPYAVVVVQRVYPPERVMLYKAQFFFVLLALGLDWLLQQSPGPRQLRVRQLLLGAGVALFTAYGTYAVVRVNPAARGTNAAYHDGLHWLAAQAPGPVLLPEPTQNLFFRFYAHTQARQHPWQLDYAQQPGRAYRYVVAFPNRRGYFQPEFPFPPAYHNSSVDIYAVPAGYTFQSAAWLH
ncbi:hypothetical protein MON38_08970 [Hymenobacter sp. DH14]|uniref:Glycosyltransferase RgtA/B/C/D-like domain-containing protein n=1 Tax=Hymenobacter cyanobacteriorum TaxID=2926463 RepID=A0A9X1VE79_9BACT|nr:hypothetical protein [Hymenobacter cyanobacteriorum]MCI1187549.1 hypothetical protein [Hymenobacter cyanobacteriorum]